MGDQNGAQVKTAASCPHDMLPIPDSSSCMNRHEVTEREYLTLFPDAWVPTAPPRSGDDRPVTNVSWLDAASYCRNRYADGTLPTVAQWRAAAGPALFATASGGISPAEALYYDARKPKGPGPVVSYPPNPNGFYELAGNVREWTRDPVAAGVAIMITLGGTWDNKKPDALRTDASVAYAADTLRDDLGFRCVAPPRYETTGPVPDLP